MAANDLARAASAALAAAPTWSSRCRWSSNLGWKFKAQASLALFDSRSYMLIFNWDYCLPPAPSVHVKAWKLLWYVKPVKQTTQRPIVILPHFREFFKHNILDTAIVRPSQVQSLSCSFRKLNTAWVKDVSAWVSTILLHTFTPHAMVVEQHGYGKSPQITCRDFNQTCDYQKTR